MCVLTMHGVLIMDMKPLMLDENEFVIENGNLVILNEGKRNYFNYLIKRYRH